MPNIEKNYEMKQANNPACYLATYCLLEKTAGKDSVLVIKGSVDMYDILLYDFKHVFYIDDITGVSIIIKKYLDKKEYQYVIKNKKLIPCSNSCDLSFDLIFIGELCELVHHFEVDGMSFYERLDCLLVLCKRLLKNNSCKLIAATHNFMFPKNLLDILKEKLKFSLDKLTIKKLTVRGFKKAFKTAGYNDIKISLIVKDDISLNQAKQIGMDPYILPGRFCNLEKNCVNLFFESVYKKPDNIIKRVIIKTVSFFNIMQYFAPAYLINAKK